MACARSPCEDATASRQRRGALSSDLTFVVTSAADATVVLTDDITLALNLTTASGVTLTEVISNVGAQTVSIMIDASVDTNQEILDKVGEIRDPFYGVIGNSGDDHILFGLLVAVVTVVFVLIAACAIFDCTKFIACLTCKKPASSETTTI